MKKKKPASKKDMAAAEDESSSSKLQVETPSSAKATTLANDKKDDDEGNRNENDSSDDDEGGGEDDSSGDDDDNDDEVMGEDPNEHDEAGMPPTLHPNNTSERSEFLDAFYGLASLDGRERARAGQVILHHALLGSEQANVSDAAYALKRLLNGLCSGRAAAREGCAATLTLFLQVAQTSGYLTKIQQQERSAENNNNNKEEGVLAYLRRRLLQASSVNVVEPGKGGRGGGGRKKDSELKDHNWGRLFGILALVRSGILVLETEEQNEETDAMETTNALFSDLHELYHGLSYMREPAAHAVCTSLTALFGSTNNPKAATKLACHAIEQSVVPLFFEKGEAKVSSLSAEQIAIALMIQSHAEVIPSRTMKKLGLLKKPLFSKETLPVLSSILGNTAITNSQWMHVVWDAIWLYLTEPSKKTVTTTGKSDPKQDKASTPIDQRVLRKSLPLVSDKSTTVQHLVEQIMEEVVLKRLLGTSARDDPEEGDGDEDPHLQMLGTHNRKMLALNLVERMAGVEFVSSLTGRTVLALNSDTAVFQEPIIRPLFLEGTTGMLSGKKRKKNRSVSEAKNVPLECLNKIVESVIEREGSETRRLLIIKSIVRCTPHFDSRAKSTTIQTLLALDTQDQKELPLELWKEFLTFVQERILLVKDADEEEMPDSDAPSISSHDANGLLDLLFRLAKRIIRLEVPKDATTNESSSLKTFQESVAPQLFSFLVAASFVTPSNNNDTKQPKSASVSFARQVCKASIPLATRKTIQARLFSLLTEATTLASTTGRDSSKAPTLVVVREAAMLKPLLHVLEDCQSLQRFGFMTARTENDSMAQDSEEGHDNKDDETDSAEMLSELLSSAKRTAKSSEPSPRHRFVLSMGLLASLLGLCLFSNQDAGSEIGEMSDMAMVNDSDEIHALIEEAKECSDSVLAQDSPKSDALSRLVALCINVISWELDESRGTSKRLIREIVKHILPSGMMIISQSSSSNAPILDSKVAEMMMDSVGAVWQSNDEDQDDSDDSDESDDDDDSEENEEEGAFSKSAASVLLDSEDEDDGEEDDAEEELGHVDKKEKGKKKDESDEEIDDDKLKSLLEEDGDMDVEENQLEHHEGADAALAMLIKRKQEARKAGQIARERVELTRQLRCVLVLETVFNGKPDGWGRLLRCDVLLSMVPSLLARISHLEKARSTNMAKGSADPSSNEWNTLLKALTNFLKSKLLKSKLSTMTWTESIDPKEHCRQVVQEVLALSQLNASTKEHKILCYQTLPTLLRCLPSWDTRVQITAEVYSGAVTEWATKKSSRITSPLFEELLLRDSCMAQIVLVKPLASAIAETTARFIKSECFRVIADIYNPKLNKGSTDPEKQALKNLAACREIFVKGTVSALKDSEMLKSKGVKEILRTTEKVLAIGSTTDEAKSSPLSKSSLELLEEGLQFALTNTNSENAKHLCQSFLEKVESWKPLVNDDQASRASKSEKTSGKKKAKKRKR